jgi:hypothetical protein
VPGRFKFATAVNHSMNNNNGILAGDLDGDGKPELIVLRNSIMTVLRNTCTPGTISFAAGIDFPILSNSRYAAIGDLDGDGKPDIVAEGSTAKVSVLKNNSSPGLIAFLPLQAYDTGTDPGKVSIGDIDGDGKPDIAVANHFSNSISILRNKIGDSGRELCPPTANTVLVSNLTGTSYQWQKDDGTGFVNISNDANHSGVTTANLQLTTIPSAWYGYQYRCVVNGVNAESNTIKFVNYWLGGVNALWEDPANWSCGTLPDMNTDVYVAAGTTVVLNSNVTIRTLSLRAGSNLSVNPGYTLTITH